MSTSPIRYLRLPVSLGRLLVQNSYMIRGLVARDIRKRYVGSLLGIFWSVVHPLIQLLLYYFVFAVVFKMRLGPEYGGTSIALWLIAGLLPWMMFAEVLNRSPEAVVEQSSVIKKMVFPSEILPIVKLAAAVLNHVIGLALLIALLLATGHVITSSLVLIVPYLLAMMFFSLGVSWALASLNVFLRDIGQVVVVFVNLWFFFTPIVYARELVPASLQPLYSVNPMLYVVEGYRTALLGQPGVQGPAFAYLLVVAFAAFAVGGLIFKKLKPTFGDVL